MKLQNVYYRAFQTGEDVLMRNFPWRSPVTVTGKNAIDRIPLLLKDAGVHKPLIVSGRHTGETLVPRITHYLDRAGIPYVCFSAVSANPTTDIVEKIRALYGYEDCDGLIAVGGGSPMDAAKAAAARLVRPEKSLEELAGLMKICRRLPPLIAVPTTAGSGSEVTMAAVITDVHTHHKHALADPALIPAYAVLDPCMSESLPPRETARCGMDALTHALEAYLSVKNNTAETLRLAEEATMDIFRYLERAYRNGQDLEAREKLLIASNKAGIAFGRVGVGYVHAIAHTFGGLYNVAHGLANAVILPIVLEDYGTSVTDKLARLSELTGTARSGSREAKAAAFIAAIRSMNARMGIPQKLEAREEDIPQMVQWALAEANPLYPVPVIYDAAHCEDVIRSII